IDRTNAKTRRAKRRLHNAKRRLDAANMDAEAARKILGFDIVPFAGEGVARSAGVVDNEKIYHEQNEKEEIMAEEVKPLFEKDPEILDEKIAFKPIEFNAADELGSISPSAPLAFTPPAPSEEKIADAWERLPTPEAPSFVPPIAPVMNTAAPVAPEPAPVQAPMAEVLRPVSPLTGTGIPIGGSTGDKPHRPTAIYYIMLIVLIVLSIFTLWLYQKNTKDTTAVPDLAVVAVEKPAPAPAKPAAKPEPAPVAESPFIAAPPAAPVPEPAPVAPQPVAEPEPEPAPAPAAEIIQEEIEIPAPVPKYQAPAPVVPDEASVLAAKGGGYDVSGAKSVGYQPEPAPVYDDSADYGDDAPMMCDDGTAPGEDGCCAGESLQYNEGFGGNVCCPSGGVQNITSECFPPLR
ncbi:MAG: hypothetical protein LBJ18_03880, partial [Rickettsiales bacterium]|nr:hypothetical protein [Rickettsiales bacterium]